MNKEEYIAGAIKDAGMTKEEAECSWHIVMAWNTYADLPVQHKSEPNDFCDAIHALQQLMAMRVARRDHPKFYTSAES